MTRSNGDRDSQTPPRPSDRVKALSGFRRAATIVIISAVLVAVGGRPSEAATASPTPAPPSMAEAKQTRDERSSPAHEERSYREREARNPEVANFRGGEGVGIYIGGSAGLLIVVLLLILVLR